MIFKRNQEKIHPLPVIVACLLYALLSLPGSAAAQPHAPGHAFTYGTSGYGLVSRDGNRLTAPKYMVINQIGQFFIAETTTPFGYPLQQAVPLDLYNAWGKFIRQIGGCFLINDSTMLTYTWMQGGRPAAFELPYNSRFLTSDVIDKILGVHAYPEAALAYASGASVSLGFSLVSYPLPGSMFIIAQDGKQGLYDAARHKLALPLQYDTVMYKPDSFFLGWNSEADHKLIDRDGKKYKSPAIVYGAGRINNAGTIFGIDLGMNSNFFKSYNDKGKLISEVSQFEPGMNYVIDYKNIAPPYYNHKVVYTRANQISSRLLDTDGKPILLPQENPGSIVVPAGGGIYLIARCPYAGPDDGALYYTGLLNAGNHKLIAKENDSTGIVVTRNLLYVKRGDKNYYYNTQGEVIAKTENVSAVKKQAGPGHYYTTNRVDYILPLRDYEVNAFETYTNLQNIKKDLPAPAGAADELPFMVAGTAYLRGPDAGYVVPGEKGQDHIFEDIKALKAYPAAEKYTRLFLGRASGKWGVYEIDPIRNKGAENYLCMEQKVKVIAAPQYDEITICSTKDNVLFCLRDKDRKVWMDTTGQVLAGGKSFDYIGFSALPDGRRLAFTLDGDNTGQTLHSVPYITKVMMIDAAGNMLKEINFNVKQKITPGELSIVDDNRVLRTNTFYDLTTGKKTSLPFAAPEYGSYRVITLKGRAVAVIHSWQTSTRANLFTKGGTSYPYEIIHLKTGRRLGNSGKGYVPFFDDAIRLESGAVITDSGDLYY